MLDARSKCCHASPSCPQSCAIQPAISVRLAAAAKTRSPVVIMRLAKHARRDYALQIACHCRVQVRTADLTVRNAERPHHIEIVTGRCCRR
jgi:hypothetical protein